MPDQQPAEGSKGDKEEALRLVGVICGWLGRGAAVLLILLLICQLALQNETFRSLATSADRWEGARLN
ncbi:hypothetical protein [Paenibacillus sp. PL2-23]|uniref:hypothetical protein n=1 Tax=Paenibacillus sp. PL2-23 TaxID=2100729 RepID=UPI0030FBFE11